MNDRQKDVLIRAGKTFFQAFMATATAQILELCSTGFSKFDWHIFAVTVGIPAMAAGLSAIQNILFPPTPKPPDNRDENYTDD